MNPCKWNALAILVLIILLGYHTFYRHSKK